MKPLFLAHWILLLLVTSLVEADTVVLYPERDATLIEDPHGERANGSGQALFTGHTSQSVNGIRRAMLYFDVAAALPKSAVIEQVLLVMHMDGGNSSPVNVGLHRLLQDWHEGPASSSGGSGAIAQAGDVTWLHTNYDVDYWRRVGGHFVKQASANTQVAGTGSYTWQDSQQLINDVNFWFHAPGRNFGWLLMGDEVTLQTAKAFHIARIAG